MFLTLTSVFIILNVITIMPSSSSAYDNYVRAYSRPVDHWLLGHWLDHTYACVLGNCYATNNSGTSGGYYSTRGLNTESEINVVICVANLDLEYGDEGVCHQHTNRMLYYGGTTLASAGINGYSYSVAAFGTYGLGSGFHDATLVCEALYGDSMKLEQSVIKNNEHYTLPVVDSEALVGLENSYNMSDRGRYYSKLLYQVASNNVKNLKKNSIQKTIEEFEVLIDWKLGIDFSENIREKMRSYHKEMLEKKKAIASHEIYEIEKEFNLYFSEYLKNISELLNNEEFLCLFGETKSEAIN